MEKKTNINSIDGLDSLDDLNKIIYLLPGNIYWKDIHGAHQGCNLNLAKMYKLNSPEEIKGKRNQDLFAKEIADEINKIDKKVIQEDREITLEEVGVNIYKEKTIYLTTKTPLHDKKGKVIGLLGVSFDITERKKAEKALAEAKEAAEAANAQIKVLAGSIAHELRTPLSTIGINLRFVEDNILNLPVENGEAVGEFCQVIRKELESANAIISMLLMNIRERLNWEKDRVESCSINSCIEEALRRYPFANGQKEKVTWKKFKDFKFKGSPIFMQHVLFNLLKNALLQIIKADKGKITIWTEKEIGGFSLHFKDTASGVPKDILPHLFERFFSRTRNGMGLGLAFCKMVVEAFGGTITCHSEEGKYAEFIMEFPLTK